jgi:hypothetical protein
MEELEEHKKKYDDLAAVNEEKRKEEMKKRLEQEEMLAKAISKCKTNTLEKVQEEHLLLKQELLKKKKSIQSFRDKITNYSSLVKEKVEVKVSDLKKEELKQKVDLLKHKPRESKDVRKQYELANLNKRMEKSTSMDKPKTPKSEKPSKELIRSIMSEKPTAVKMPDYLTELRKKRGENYNAAKAGTQNWNHDLNNEELNPTEKYNRMLSKASLIEEQAKMKEKILHAKGGTHENPELGEFVSDMYIDAINAKLAILQHL